MEAETKIICSMCGYEGEGSIGDYCPICGKKFGEEDLVPNKEPKAAEPEKNESEKSEPVPVVAGPINEDRGTSGLWNVQGTPIGKKGLGKILPLLVVLCAVIFLVSKISGSGQEEEQEASVTSETITQTDFAVESLSGGNSLTEEDGSTEAKALSAEVLPSAPSGYYVQLTISTASATSILEAESEEYHYEPSRAIDGNLITSWQEGAPGNGEGEELTISFPQKERVKYVCLYTGNWRDAQRFYNNCRPASMTIFLGNQEFPVKFQDGMKNWYVVFPEAIETSRITFRIDSVYTGTMSPDLCISEVYAYGER